MPHDLGIRGVGAELEHAAEGVLTRDGTPYRNAANRKTSRAGELVRCVPVNHVPLLARRIVPPGIRQRAELDLTSQRYWLQRESVRR